MYIPHKNAESVSYDQQQKALDRKQGSGYNEDIEYVTHVMPITKKGAQEYTMIVETYTYSGTIDLVYGDLEEDNLHTFVKAETILNAAPGTRWNAEITDGEWKTGYFRETAELLYKEEDEFILLVILYCMSEDGRKEIVDDKIARLYKPEISDE